MVTRKRSTSNQQKAKMELEAEVVEKKKHNGPENPTEGTLAAQGNTARLAR